MLSFTNYTEPKYKISNSKRVIVGSTRAMINLFHYLNHLAAMPSTILLTGETGTGKELCAMALHYNGSRKNCNFVAVNCAGIPTNLLESELFGYTKGSFTGAYTDMHGKFQHADKGTILLDEIGDMDLVLQSKILRVLQEKQVTRVGSNRSEGVDVRIIASTNKDLEKQVENGSFREDLYFRLNVVPITIPSLRERKSDIPLIAEYFIEKYNEIYSAGITGLYFDAIEKLKEHEWRGNVRELENVMERVFVVKKSGLIEPGDLHFNSGIPLSEITQFSEEERKDFTLEDITDKLWYTDGILPIPPKELSRLSGARPYTEICRAINENLYFADRFGLGQRQFLLLYLTPKNLRSFFNDVGTEDYKHLEEEINRGEFNKIAGKPFKFFRINDLAANVNAFNSYTTIGEIFSKLDIYAVKTGKGHYFALTEDNAELFVPKSYGFEERLRKLKTEVASSYEKFKNWTPKPR